MKIGRSIRVLSMTILCVLTVSSILPYISQPVSANSQQTLFQFYFPWNDGEATSIDLSVYLHKPAGKYGHVYVGSDGRLYVGSQRIRFLGINLVSPAIFAPQSVAEALAKRFAKYGINLVRLHALDAHWTSDNIFRAPGTRELDPTRLDRLDYLVAKLKENGIYVNINLLCYRSFSSSDGLPREVDSMNIKDKHILGFFYKPVRDLQKEFARKLLTHVNPYTGLSYAEDPAIAFIEILNEYGMVFGWFDGAVDRLPDVFKSELQKKWNEYLRQKYGSTTNLRNAWGRLYSDENLEAGTVRIFTLSEYSNRPTAAQRDWAQFLWYLDYDYFRDMYNYLKNELKVKALVIGTQMTWGGTPNIMQHMDLADSHGYWNYPAGNFWSGDYYVLNTAMVNNPTSSTIVGMANQKIAGKPHTISEYNHPFPNMYRAEGWVFLSAYGAFHDWDGILPYCYGDPDYGWNFDTRRIMATLDFGQDPQRWAMMITAHMLFVRGDVQVARQWVAVELSRDQEIEFIRSRTAGVWNLPNGRMAGNPAHTALLHGVVVVPSNRSRPPNTLLPRDVPAPSQPVYVSDTGELIWDCRESGRCVFIVNTSRSKVLTGFIGGKRFDLGEIVIEVKNTLLNGWATIAIHVIEGSSFRDAKRVLVVAVGLTTNTETKIYNYDNKQLLFTATTDLASIPNLHGLKLTTYRDMGRAPTITEGIEATITIKTSNRATAYALDNIGKRKSSLSVTTSGGNQVISIGSSYQTLWYEVTMTTTTPTSTPTPTTTTPTTPITTPTPTPTPTTPRTTPTTPTPTPTVTTVTVVPVTLSTVVNVPVTVAVTFTVTSPITTVVPVTHTTTVPVTIIRTITVTRTTMPITPTPTLTTPRTTPTTTTVVTTPSPTPTPTGTLTVTVVPAPSTSVMLNAARSASLSGVLQFRSRTSGSISV
ncbi:MAG: beta-galactosidase, partial [Ignisphaera sp.]